MPTFEYRKLFRVNIALKVEYKTLREPILGGVAFSKNMSSTGINIVIPYKLERNTQLELQIYIPENEKPITARGIIVWQTECSYVPKSKKKYYSYGIKFSQMQPEEAIAASDFVRDVLKKQSDTQVKKIIDMIENFK
ncbi:MAG: PilZ domain-containing protein [Candidatus Omnitrophota bacterium]